MKNEYLHFKKYLIKNDTFSKQFFIEKILDNSLLRFRLIKEIVLKCKFLEIFSWREKSEEDFVVFRKGRGKIGTDIFFKIYNNKFYIEKVYPEYDLLKKEFYTLGVWKNKSKIILVPEFRIIDDNKLRFDYQEFPNLKKMIIYKEITFDRVIEIYKQISQELENIYLQTNINHGDLGPEHIFVQNEKYVLIDFTDTMTVDKKYDPYILLKCILKLFNKENLIHQYFCEDEIKRYDKIYLKKTNEKHFG
ncbi:MAG: RIO1 family regulatory kinase/ATPase [Candidatus Magasanikiibacteriota bacterium]